MARGFDWIEYTAPVEIRDDVAARLQELVQGAKDGQAQPVYLGAKRGPDAGWERQRPLFALPFTPLPKSARFYKWGLSNEELGITLWFTDSPHRPGVKVEIRSHALWHFGQREAYDLTRRAVGELCKVGDGWPARPARLDLAADFQGLGLSVENAAEVVSRAAKRETNADVEQLCPRCPTVLSRDDKRCSQCGWPRWRLFEGRHVVGGIPTAGCKPVDEETEALLEPRWKFQRDAAAPLKREKVWTVASAERSPIRPVYVPLEPLHRRQHGGFAGRKFTGWEYGSGAANKVNVYLKTEEIDSASPDKVWFYRTWGRTPGYVFSRCPSCGRSTPQAEIVAAAAPSQPTEAPRGKKSGHARVVLPLCPKCYRVHEIEAVWRIEARVRGDVLTRFAPRGRQTITTVEECFQFADELWHYVVGAPERRCIKCGDIPKGKEQRHRYCRACELFMKLELKRELGEAEKRTIRLIRRRGWFEARDSSGNPSGRPTRWPIANWWQHVQSVHFDGSAPPTEESRKLKALASADINRAMARGCALSTLDADNSFDRWARANGGAAAMPLEDFKSMVRNAVLGDDLEWEVLFQRFVEKRGKRGLAAPELAAPGRSSSSSSSGPPRQQGRRPGRPAAPAPVGGAPIPDRVYREVEFNLDAPGGALERSPHGQKTGR
ncbi:MAG TPA: hypothetical protein VF814_04705 [Casimicrobiaceae bacterium]